MGKRQMVMLACLVILAASDVVKVHGLKAWAQLIDVGTFCALLGAAAGAVIGFLMKSHRDDGPESKKPGEP